MPEKPEYVLALHGGAGGWKIDAERHRETLDGLQVALALGRDLMARGATSLDAVEQVVCCLEDIPCFNAGRGSVLNLTGSIRMDAAIMNGQTRAAGAVAGVAGVRHAVSLARRVMEKTSHVMLIGEGAEKLARDEQLEFEPPEWFVTDWHRNKWQEDLKAMEREKLPSESGDHFGTVGCVALDAKGDLAAATSTGGTARMMFGRVGDTPIVGAGTYADNRTCAVSATGQGELFIRHSVAYDVAARIQYAGAALADAASAQVAERLPEGTGGLIAIDRVGNVATVYNTPGMARGVMDSRGRFEVALDPV